MMQSTDTDPDTLSRLALDLMRSSSHSLDEAWTYMSGEALPSDADLDLLEASDLDLAALIRVGGDA
jgi:hypothetical protein